MDVDNQNSEFRFRNQIDIIRYGYLIWALLGSIGLIMAAFIGDSDVEGINFGFYLMNIFILMVICYGLFQVKQWVVPIILLFSYWGIFDTLSEFLTPPSTLSGLISSRIYELIFLIFWIYQIYIFSKKETRSYYKAKAIGII